MNPTLLSSHQPFSAFITEAIHAVPTQVNASGLLVSIRQSYVANVPNPNPAIAARDYLRSLVVGRQVGIRRITKDGYDRTVAELFVDVTNVQQQLVASGHAEIY